MATNDTLREKEDVIMMEDSVPHDLEGNPEKAPQVYHLDGFNVLGLSADDAEFYQNYSPADRKRTKHKVSPLETATDVTISNDQLDDRSISD